METKHRLSAAAAAARLGIKRATLYAYVSRGLLTAFRQPDKRGSWFDPVQLDGLMRRARDPAERRPDIRMTSAITLIEDGEYWYRGVSPHVLADTRTFESVAEWLWTSRDTPMPTPWNADPDAVAEARRGLALLPLDAFPTDRLRVIVSLLAAADPLRGDLRPSGALATCRRLVAGVVTSLARATRGSVAARIASSLSRTRLSPSAVEAIDRVLIIMADHELAASTVAVRVAASFRADPYAVVVAGLGAMTGSRHGAASRQLEELLREIERGRPAAQLVGRMLEREDVVPGFGHPLYPDGDPRVPTLLRIAHSGGPYAPADTLLAVARSQGLPPPNVDFGLATLTRTLQLPIGTGEAIFAIARLVGWLAHALEEYADRTDFRLRAVYIGPRPEPRHLARGGPRGKHRKG